MDQRLPLPDDDSRSPSAAEQEAGEWFAQIDSGRADLTRFEAWRSADPRNAAAYARIAATWDALSSARGQPLTQPDPAQSDRPGRHFSRRSALGSLVGGGAVLAIGGGLAASKVYARESAATQVGEQRKIALASGVGMIALNTDSAASWRVDGSGAEFWLDRGEMAIALSPSVPANAILHGGGHYLEIGPGRYNARIFAGLLEVAMLEGHAELPTGAVAGADAGGTVRTGERILLDARPHIRPMSARDVDVMLSWPEGELLFNDEPLASAVQEYNRYLNRKIVIADQQVGRIRIGGRFTSSNPNSFISALEAGFPVQAVAGENSVILTSR